MREPTPERGARSPGPLRDPAMTSAGMDADTGSSSREPHRAAQASFIHSWWAAELGRCGAINGSVRPRGVNGTVHQPRGARLLINMVRRDRTLDYLDALHFFLPRTTPVNGCSNGRFLAALTDFQLLLAPKPDELRLHSSQGLVSVPLVSCRSRAWLRSSSVHILPVPF